MTCASVRAATLSALALALALGCARNVAVGHEDALGSAGGSASGGETSQAGSAASSAAGDGAAGDPGTLLWSADHEVASFGEWLSDGTGIRFLQGTGALAVTSEQAHSGQHAFIASITTDDGQLHQAMMGRSVSLREARYGAWYLLPEAPRADYWVIMKLSNGPDNDRFDIDIEALPGGAAHLRLFEHLNQWISEPARVPFPIGRWVHVEALYRSTPDADGRLIVLQDGETVFDTGPRPTADDELVTFFCGSTSRFVSPSPFHLFVDDASISRFAFP